ncbi:hypothetical protein J8I29_26415 [Labrys sp. LIt4]|uniref:Antifreeze protein n=1 Tax=Labrys okinawensis TaxID=346911 RepID=A0A2S9QBB7_9HYPH|nr:MULTISPECIES: hypothetical protein [Labrys]MBP0582888.1 hypothetical protein [Labrys sp. LIt4]PRH86610.1 hypothetical protein C5L14_14875 [Labrys okinawensis]
MFKLFYDMSMLAFESQQAIWLRTLRLAQGGSRAEHEAKLMISEKVAAAQNAAGKLMMGTTPGAVVRDYRRKVRSNVKRLSKP